MHTLVFCKLHPWLCLILTLLKVKKKHFIVAITVNIILKQQSLLRQFTYYMPLK